MLANRRPGRLPLYWQVCLINGAVFAVGTVALALSPATVSTRLLLSEAVVLVVGLTVMLLTNAALLRASLAPVDRVVRQMEVVELHDGFRLPPPGSGYGDRLVRSYNAMLDRLEEERRTSNARELAAQEAERQRIAQELHDQVGQDLTVVLLGLKQLAGRVPPDVLPELELLRESARASLDDVRRVARELRPGVLADLGLVSALAALCSDLTSHGGPPVRRRLSPGLPTLPTEHELVVYRVAQEALTNAARHAGATQVDLTLVRSGESLVLEVSDDGAAGRPIVPGAGIAGMRERARLVDGTLEVLQPGGRGAVVRLTVPLPEEPA